MSIQGPIPVNCNFVFGRGVGAVSDVTPVIDFDASTRENKVQAHDKQTGLPLWQVEVMDFDPEARERTVKIKVAAAKEPELPEPVEGAAVPIRPIQLEGLTVTPYVKESNNGRGRLAYSFRAEKILPARPRAEKAA